MYKLIKKYRTHLKSGALFISSVSFTTVVSVIAGFLVLRWVGPEEMGVWQLLLLINSYGLFGGLGITTGLARELPFLLGKGDNKLAFRLASTSKAFSLFCSFLTLFVLIIFLVYYIFIQKDKIFIITFTTIMLMLSISFYKDYVLTLFRSNTAFQKLSTSFLIQGIISIFLLPLIYLFKYKGYLIYNLLNAIISFVLLLRINPIRVKSKFITKNFILLFKTGMPLFLMGYFYSISRTFIKFAILHYGGIYLLGIFAPVFAIRNGISILPKSIAQFIYPKLTFKLGKTNNPKVLWPPVRNISLALLFSLILLSMPLYIYIPEILNYFFPDYSSSLLPCRFALLSGIIYSSFIGITALNSIKGYKERFFISTFYLILSLITPFLIPYFFENKIVGLAWAIIITDLLYFIAAYIITRNRLLKGS